MRTHLLSSLVSDSLNLRTSFSFTSFVKLKRETAKLITRSMIQNYQHGLNTRCYSMSSVSAYNAHNTECHFLANCRNSIRVQSTQTCLPCSSMTCRHLSRMSSKSVNSSEFVGSEDSSTLLHKRFIFVKICDGIWEDVPQGCSFDVEYLDSHPDKPYDKLSKVIVGLHGTDANNLKIEEMLSAFVKIGYRVIIPSFPGHGQTSGVSRHSEDAFDQSTECRALFLNEFLRMLSIEQVHLMVGHSGGCYPMVALPSILNRECTKAMAFISPSPHRVFQQIEPYHMMTFLSGWWDRPFWRMTIRLIVLCAKISGQFKALRSLSIKQSIELIRISANFQFEEIPGHLMAVDSMKTPLVMFYGLHDPFVSKNHGMVEEYAKYLGLDEDHFTMYDEEKTEQGARSYPRGLIFKDGDHYLQFHEKYRLVIINELWQLLKFVEKGR